MPQSGWASWRAGAHGRRWRTVAPPGALAGRHRPGGRRIRAIANREPALSRQGAADTAGKLPQPPELSADSGTVTDCGQFLRRSAAPRDLLYAGRRRAREAAE